MKKIGLLICSLFIIPFGALAATNPNVKDLNAEVSVKTISYKGTMESGSHAVMCKLYNNKAEEIDLLSSAVDNTKFEGQFIVSTEGTYTLACANYEGGELKKIEVTVEDKKEAIEENNENQKADETSSNPKTGDVVTNIIILLLVSIIGFVGAIFILKKKTVKTK